MQYASDNLEEELEKGEVNNGANWRCPKLKTEECAWWIEPSMISHVDVITKMSLGTGINECDATWLKVIVVDQQRNYLWLCYVLKM